MIALNIEVHAEGAAPARYLVQGHSDMLWTDSIREALAFLKGELKTLHRKGEWEERPFACRP